MSVVSPRAVMGSSNWPANFDCKARIVSGSGISYSKFIIRKVRANGIQVILNIEDVINIIREWKPGGVHTGHESMHLKLTTGDGRLIYSTKDFELFEDVSHLLSPFNLPQEEHKSGTIREGHEPGEGLELSVHAHSKGYRDFKGLGWILMVDHDLEEVFAHSAKRS